jgi:hypothetical protein
MNPPDRRRKAIFLADIQVSEPTAPATSLQARSLPPEFAPEVVTLAIDMSAYVAAITLACVAYLSISDLFVLFPGAPATVTAVPAAGSRSHAQRHVHVHDGGQAVVEAVAQR